MTPEACQLLYIRFAVGQIRFTEDHYKFHTSHSRCARFTQDLISSIQDCA